ncbi:MAG TPA: flagellar hook-associated protein FlgL [Acidimicrobiia bacterium]|jgi:flagellar hook-associated protein 3 FlgL|nr:flagellar hook-associated protein FlgL [Acidimicrobiia bacterium]
MAVSDFRITQRTLSSEVMSNLQRSLGKLQQIQEQMSSGKVLNRPSDSPTAAVSSLAFRSQLTRSQQYQRNISDGIGWLGIADSTLQSVVSSMQRVRQLAVNGTDGAMSSQDRSALAEEVDQLRAGLVTLANTTYQNRPLFGGNTTSATAYDANGVYQGDSGGVTRTIAPGVQLDVNVTGGAVFGSGASGLFGTLQQLSDDLRTNPANLQGDLTAIDGHMTTILSALGDVGARYRRLETTKNSLDTNVTGLQQSLSEVEDVDLPQVIMQLQTQQVAYQAALAATSKVIQPSLVDFLK